MESIGRLAGGVAHDLNNLLFPILGYGEILLEDAALTEAQKDTAKEIIGAGKRARDLVRQLLAFSRKQMLEFKPIDVNDLVTNLEKLLRRTLRENIAIHLFPNVGVLYMSGYTDDVIARHGVIDEGVHFIEKPFHINALAAKVREILNAEAGTHATR